MAALKELAADLREEGVFVSVFQWWPAAAKLLPELFTLEERRHAGAEETSLNLALHARLVSMSRTVDTDPLQHALQIEGLTLPLDTIDETGSGVYGKSTTASANKGRRVFEIVVNELAKHVRLLKEARAEDLVQKPKV